MADLDTEIEGEVANVRAVGRWLRQDLRTGFDDLATTVAQQRTDAAGDWQGEAGTAFSGRARELAQSGDDGASITGHVATLVDDLAEDMRTAKDAMADVRTAAREGDLVVDGFTVRNPGDGPPAAGQSPTPDATRRSGTPGRRVTPPSDATTSRSRSGTSASRTPARPGTPGSAPSRRGPRRGSATTRRTSACRAS